MLVSSDKVKVEKYIQKIMDGLIKEAKESIRSGMSDQQVIDRITKATVNKIIPESKMMLSSVYNMLMDDTLSEDFFQTIENKTLFYEAEILKDLYSKFSFEVPTHIDYEESKRELDKWLLGGSATVVIAGGIASIKFKSCVHVGVSLAVVIAAIMGVLLLNNGRKSSKIDIEMIVLEYFNSVHVSLLAWIETIEEYYEKKVESLKKGTDL